MADELYRDVRWSDSIVLPVMGVATKFATNAPELLEVVRETYGSWSELGGRPDLVAPSPAIVRLILTEDAASPSDLAFRYRLPDPTRMLITSPAGAGVADTTRADAVGYVSRDLLAHPAELAEGLLEPLTLFLLGALDRQPLHAAAVARGGSALLLEGPSGTGKSTLTYAATRLGFAALADEAVYVQLLPMLRVWSRRSRIHLRPEARAHFPELRDVPATRLPGGKTRIVIPASAGAPRRADRVGFCLLRRGSRASLERIAPEQVAHELKGRVEPGYDIYEATVAERARRVAAAGAWVLTLGPDPNEAAALLDDAERELARAE